MPAFLINDAEWNALVEEPGDVFLAYCAIRRFMDYGTGVAGERRRLSEQMIREVLYVAPTRGRHESGSPSRQRVRSVIDRLIKLGILAPIGPMVFELPLADRDGLSKRSATNQQPHHQPDQQPTQIPLKPSKNAALTEDTDGSETTSASPNIGNSNLPPVSGKTNTQHNACARETDSRARFAMTDSWEPELGTFEAVLHRNGLSNKPLNPDHLLEFRSYWIAQPDKHNTQAQWEHKLAQQLKRQHQISEGKPNETSRPNAGKRARNAVDVLNNDRW